MEHNINLKKRKSSREIKRELRSIYTGADGKIPDMSKLSRGDSGLTRMLVKVIIFLLVISVLAWTGFFLFTQGLFQNDESLILTIDGPEDVLSGQEINYTIRYENSGTVPIASLTMKLNLPSSFHVYTTIPEATAGEEEWEIGSLTPGSDGAITLSGVFLSEVPSTQRLQALFTYKPANFSSEFQDIATHKVNINESVVALTLSGPEKALAGDEAEYIINIQNTGTDPVYNLRMLPTLPGDFSISDSEPKLEDGVTFWTINTLAPGELAAITIHGSFTSTASGEQTVTAAVGFVDEDLFLTQSSEDLVTDVLGGSLGFGLIVNGSNASQTAEAGKVLRLSIDYKNNSDQQIKNLGFELSLYSGNGNVPIDWENADLDEGERSGNTIAFSGASYDSLKELGPSESGVIDVSLPVIKDLTETDADQFSIELKAILSEVAGISSIREIEVTPIVISLNSDTQVSSHARYYSTSGAAIGSGPLPPKVGETTTLRVYWNLSNGLHALDNIEFSTTLPQDVAWLDSTDTDIGTVSYNATTRQVSWKVSRLPTSVGSAGAWFDIAINPDDQDVGTFMKLTNSTSFSATDSQTKEKLTQTMDIITTELPLDDYATGQGVVLD